MSTRCFDIFKVVSNSVSNEYLSEHKLNEDKERLLRKECGIFDALANETDGVGFIVVISDESGDISISLDFMYDLSVLTKSVPFLDLIQDNTKTMMISRVEEDMLRLTFVFDPIWD